MCPNKDTLTSQGIEQGEKFSLPGHRAGREGRELLIGGNGSYPSNTDTALKNR